MPAGTCDARWSRLDGTTDQLFRALAGADSSIVLADLQFRHRTGDDRKLAGDMQPENVQTAREDARVPQDQQGNPGPLDPSGARPRRVAGAMACNWAVDVRG
jgi:hypothetical protein